MVSKLALEALPGCESWIAVGAYLAICLAEVVVFRSITMSPVVGIAILIAVAQWYQSEAREERVKAARIAKGRAAVMYAASGAQVKETSVAISKMIQTLWAKYFAARASLKALPILQRALEVKLSEKYEGKVVAFDFGTAAPVIKDVATRLAADGSLAAVDSKFYWESDGLEMTISVKTPIGVVKCQVNKIIMSGTLRIIPIAEENLLAISFLETPKLDYGVNLTVGKTKGNVGQFTIFKKLMNDALANVMTEPRRKIIALDVGEVPQGVICQSGTLRLCINSLAGPALDLAPGITIVAQVGDVSKACSSFKPGSQQEPCTLSFELQGDSAHRVFIKVLGKSGKAEELIGQAVVDVMYLPCGSTAMWVVAEDGGVLAKRWKKHQGPWKVDLPLEVFKAPRVTEQKSESPSQDVSKMLASSFVLSQWQSRRKSTDPSLPQDMQPEDSEKSLADLPPLGNRPEEDALSRSLDASRDESGDVGCQIAALLGAQVSAPAAPSSPRIAALHIPTNPAFRSFVSVSLSVDEWRVSQRACNATPRTPGARAVAVHICSASGLKVPNNTALYATVMYGDLQLKTTFKRFAPDPLFNAVFAIPENTFAVGNELRFKITGTDSNLTTGPTEYAKCKLSLNGLPENKVHAQKLELAGADAGHVSVEVAIHPGSVYSSLVGSSMEYFKRKLNPDMIEVIIEQGRDLILCGQSSNPYVTCTYGKQTQSTAPVHKSVNPQWQCTFQFRHDPAIPQTLHVRCKDKDVIQDGAMGHVVVDMTKLAASFQGWVQLRGARSGEVFLRIFRGAASVKCGSSPGLSQLSAALEAKGLETPTASMHSNPASATPPAATASPPDTDLFAADMRSEFDPNPSVVYEAAFSGLEAESSRFRDWLNTKQSHVQDSLMNKLKSAAPTSLLKTAQNYSPNFLKKAVTKKGTSDTPQDPATPSPEPHLPTESPAQDSPAQDSTAQESSPLEPLEDDASAALPEESFIIAELREQLADKEALIAQLQLDIHKIAMDAKQLQEAWGESNFHR